VLLLMVIFAGTIHQILLEDFSMQMSLKTVNYNSKNLGYGDGRFLQKNLGFGIGFGHRNNTSYCCIVVVADDTVPSRTSYDVP